MHDALTIGVPVLAILAGILFNRSDVKDLRAEMRARFDRVDEDFDRVDARVMALSDRVDSRFNRVDARFDRVDARFDQVDARFNRVDVDLRQFYAVTGKLEGRIDEISKK